MHRLVNIDGDAFGHNFLPVINSDSVGKSYNFSSLNIFICEIKNMHGSMTQE